MNYLELKKMWMDSQSSRTRFEDLIMRGHEDVWKMKMIQPPIEYAKILDPKDDWSKHVKEALEESKAQLQKTIKDTQSKTLLMVYCQETDGDIQIERLTKEQIKKRIKKFNLDRDDYTVIDGNIVKDI